MGWGKQGCRIWLSKSRGKYLLNWKGYILGLIFSKRVFYFKDGTNQFNDNRDLKKY